MKPPALPLTLLIAALTLPAVARAGDDPSIVDPLRTQIQESMAAFVENQTIDGVVRHYDPISGEVLRLELAEFHSGIARKGDFFVSCADFSTADGHTVDLDFLVLREGEGVRTVQSIVHSVDGEKRPYQLEETP